MSTHDALRIAIYFFPISEVGLTICKRGTIGSKVDDRGSLLLLWLVIAGSVVGAMYASNMKFATFPGSPETWDIAAAVLVIAGLALRWWAIMTLGRFFTTNIATHDGQTVVTSGPYRYVRHPSYTGLLLVLLGIGLFFQTWQCAAVLMGPITLAIAWRIYLEEAVLLKELGAPYAAYMARTKRLIPRLV